MHFEAEMPHKPVVAIEIKDRKPDDWSLLLFDVWGDALNDPAMWATAGPKRAGADVLQMTLSLTIDGDQPNTPAKRRGCSESGARCKWFAADGLWPRPGRAR